MFDKPAFIQGVFSFTGLGLDKPLPFTPKVSYTVPSHCRAQVIYLCAGSSAGELTYLLLTRRGQAMRYFPIGAHSAVHVSLAVIEDLSPETELEILFAAPAGVSGTFVIDIGLVEIS